MCSLFSAELEPQSGSERVEARRDQTPEFRLFESAFFSEGYPVEAVWVDALDSLRRLDFYVGEHRQHAADCLAGVAA
jgi:hypothetical protein